MTWMEWWGRVRVGTPRQTTGRAEEDSDVAFTSQLKVDRVAETLGGHGSCELTGLGTSSCQLPFRGTAFRGEQGQQGAASGNQISSLGTVASHGRSKPLCSHQLTFSCPWDPTDGP